MNRKTTCETERFPRFITDLPEADIQFKSVRAWISQGDNHQVVFFDIAASGEVTEHYHETPQWGVVVEGEMELTIDGETKVYRKGDEYHIPAIAKHSARFRSRFRSIDFFCEKHRYRPKKTSGLKRNHIQLVLATDRIKLFRLPATLHGSLTSFSETLGLGKARLINGYGSA